MRGTAGTGDTAEAPLPSIAPAKGGGAIRGIGEKFAANPATGTASLSVPIPTSTGRAGFGPELALSYDSGYGNGACGYGWNLAIPAVTRKTDDGLPRYCDADESDVYVLSFSEDLVPVVESDSERFEADGVPGYVVHRYRPRVEGLFARIERWTAVATGHIHWRSISRDNVTALYGTDGNSRVSDPADPRRVFSWLIAASYDDKGNAIVYEYAEEDDANVDRGQANERNRLRTANRYLKRVQYGNRVSRLVEPDLTQASWLFEVVFDYDEGHYVELEPDPGRPEAEQHIFVQASASPGRPWAVRPDPFSTHRPGFELRTYRRCRRVLMFHHIPDLPTGEAGYDGLVRSMELDYADLRPGVGTVDAELAHQGSTRFGSFLRTVTESGYVRDTTRPVITRDGVEYATYLKRSLPPLQLEYSRPAISDAIRELDAASAENLPLGVDESAYKWVDLDGDAVSGVLAERDGAWLYKPNLGDGRLGPARTLATAPAPAAGERQLLDLAGDGRLDVVSLSGPAPGFYERTENEDWEPFRPFRQLPNVAWDDPNVRLVDLDGDGLADVLVTEHDAITWHRSLGEEGFGPGVRVSRPHDEERGPRLLLADGAQSVYLADMSGDGLTDLVRIRNGEVCYWPNRGYGRFGAKVTMDDSPWFDAPDHFDQRRIRLADIDGSGTNDVIYLGRDGVRLYFNLSGNRLSAARPVAAFPAIDDVSSVMAADLLGKGTACLVWSSSLPAAAGRPLRYVDLMGGTKPHLLVRHVNNLGAETEVHYAPSTRFSLSDKRDGRPWATRLPFPVHVVERVVVHDRVAGNRFVTRFAYHHGHFDGIEREFRGFGMVEQWDTEELASLGGDASDVPPVLTRTWFHTGAYHDGGSDPLAREYYRAPGSTAAQLLEDAVLPAGLSAAEEREACRALKGGMLRQEVYAQDGTDREPHPYTVAEQSFAVRVLQRRHGNPHGVFHAHRRESLSLHYERNPADPRVAHSLTLEVDEFGNTRRSAAVGYGRRQADTSLPPADRAEQARIRIVYVESAFTNAIDAADDHRTPRLCESRTYELTGLGGPPPGGRFAFDALAEAGSAAVAIDYETEPQPGVLEKRMIEHLRTYLRRDDLAGPLPLGTQESRALPYETHTSAFTPGLIAELYGGRVTDTMLETEGGYVHSEGDAGWWIPSGRHSYSPGPGDTPAQELAYARAHFFLPQRFRDPFHTSQLSTEMFVAYDAYDLLLQETRDSADNRVTVGERGPGPGQPLVARGHDYRVLRPTMIMDPNRNRSGVAFDALGLVVGTAVMGKPEETPVPGDRLTSAFRANLTPAEIDALLADPKRPSAATLVGDASTRMVYDLDAYRREAAPAVAVTLGRETHASEPAPAGGLLIQASLSYSDGFGREIQRKLQAEPEPGGGSRWTCSGWTEFNNKGAPVRRYEPFFTATHRYESDVRAGVSPIVVYDPAGRVVATLHPNHTWEKVVFDAWRHETWDVNDTVLVTDPAADADVGGFLGRLPAEDYLPTWHALRTDPAHAAEATQRWPDPRTREAERRAATGAAVHAATPSVSHADSLGRSFLKLAHNRALYTNAPAGAQPVDDFHRTRTTLDIEGNEREMTDPGGRAVVRYGYDMLGKRLVQSSMEAGEHRQLDDVSGKRLYAWDSRGHRFRTSYDTLRRPTGSFLSVAGDAESTVGRVVYGDSRPSPEAANLRGKVVEIRDQAGVMSSDAYDFKGNLLRSSRRLAQDYAGTLDWSGAVPLESATYASRTRYDALDRPIQLVAPHSDEPGAAVNVSQPAYNEANLLERVDVWLERQSEPAGLLDPGTADLPAVTGVDYDALGRRTRIRYGNGVTTIQAYDALTFRLAHLLTRREAHPEDCPGSPAPEWPGCQVQNLHYTYDPAGNITTLRDDAQQTVFFRNRRVEPSAAFTYDALYRLIEATGREHLGQGGAPAVHSSDGPPPVPHPGDGQAMGRYLERYVYDAVGNLLAMQHNGSDTANAGWTRSYVYDEASQLEPSERSNRLTRTTVGALTETYSVGGDGYDAHGNLLRMPHLHEVRWDYDDRMRMTRRQVSAGQGERTFYVYDVNGRRVRKVTELARGQVKDERIYLDGFEIYRRQGLDPLVRETLHVTDDREQRIAVVETRTRGTEPQVPRQRFRYQLGNHLGSVSLELSEAAQVVTYEEYAPYGSTTYQAVRSQTEPAKRYRYTGKERDEESGLYYHGARYYAPWIARWVACDPKGPVRHLCLYGYCDGNPVILHDPSGAEGTTPLPGLIGNDPKLGKLWEQAVVDALGEKFDAKTYGEVVTGFKAELEARIKEKGMGSNRKEGTGINFARETYAKARTRFGQLAKAAGYDLTDVQIHHTFDEIAKQPAGAIDTSNLGVQRGNARSEGSSHNFAHKVKDAHEAGVKQPGQHVVNELGAKGINPDVPELAPSLRARSVPDVPDLPRGKKPRLKGPLGFIIGGVTAGVIYGTTGDAYAAGQAVNPLANTTDAALSVASSGEDVAWAAAEDVVAWTPPGQIWSILQMMGPEGHSFMYDPKLKERALREGRNPFCAQCHGPGGALDPNNEWNLKARYGSIPTLTQPQYEKLMQWVESQPAAGK